MESDDDNDDGDSNSSKDPCCSFWTGLILIIIAPYVIWHNEGDYVKIQQALDEAGRHAKEPCNWDTTGTCDNCRLDDLKEGDLVFLSCRFNNMRTLTDLAKEKKFEIEELVPALSGSEEAVGFNWKAEMYQWMASSSIQEIPLDTPDCQGARGLDDETDRGATRRKSACCNRGQVGYQRFLNQYYGPGKRCSPYVGGPNHSEAELVQADISFAKEAQVGRIAFENNELNEDQAEIVEFQNHSMVQVRRLKGRSKDTRRRRTNFKCSFDCHSWELSWHDKLTPDPQLWSPIPSALHGVKYVSSSPAQNLNLPYQGEQSYLSDTDDGVNLGGITVGSFKPIRDAMKYDKVANPSPNWAMGRETLGFTHGEARKLPGSRRYTVQQRNMSWTAKEASLSGNCLVSRNDQHYEVGDLKICFKKTSLTNLTVLAEVKKAAKGLKLAVSEKHLKADAKLKMTTSGYRLEPGRLIRFNEYMQKLNEENEGLLFAFRIIGPCLLWAAFYCCLWPIVWLIDKFGDRLESVPCVGGCLGILADIWETLARILICIISCCCGLACGLMAMAVAWVYYRPLIGIPLLILSTAMFVGVGYFMYARRDPNKPPRRSVRMSTVGEVELQEQRVQSAVAAHVAAHRNRPLSRFSALRSQVQPHRFWSQLQMDDKFQQSFLKEFQQAKCSKCRRRNHR